MGHSPLVFPIVLALVSVFYAYCKWDEAPNPIPVWWDINSHPVLYLSRWFGFFVLPALMILVSSSIYLLSSYDTSVDQFDHEAKHAVHHLIVLPAVFLFVVQNFVLVDVFVSRTGDFEPALFVACIALWLMIWLGYNIQYIEPNHSVGIVTPWTVNSIPSWKATHSHAAWILISVGLVLLICAFTVPAGVPLLVVTLVLWLGSYVYLFFYSACADSIKLRSGEANKEITAPLTSASV